MINECAYYCICSYICYSIEMDITGLNTTLLLELREQVAIFKQLAPIIYQGNVILGDYGIV